MESPQILIRLKHKLQPEFQVPRINLYIGDPAELTTELVHGVCGAVGMGRQAPIIVRQSQALVIEDIKCFEAKLNVPALREFKVLQQCQIRSPEAWGTCMPQPIAGCPKAPERIDCIRIKRRAIRINTVRHRIKEVRVRSKDCLESIGVEPLLLLLVSTLTAPPGRGIAEEIWPIC